MIDVLDTLVLLACQIFALIRLLSSQVVGACGQHQAGAVLLLLNLLDSHHGSILDSHHFVYLCWVGLQSICCVPVAAAISEQHAGNRLVIL